MKRYEHLVELLAGDIRNGRLAPGTRLPSIRTITTQHGLSASTAFKAYYRLEEKGLVRARPRSGYYVTASAMPPLAAPALGQAASKAARASARVAPRLDVSELVFSVLGAVQDPDIVPLGSAFPAPALFPLQRLGKSLARTARQIHGQDAVAHLPQGDPVLRRQIALRYLGMGMPQPAEELIVTSGALEALNLCLTAVAQPGDLIAIESPGFYAGLQATHDEGAGNSGAPAGGPGPGGAGGGAQASSGQGLLVHDLFPEPHGRQSFTGEKEGAGRAAGQP